MSDTYWNVKVYDEDGERETLRGLPYGRAVALMQIFEREGVKAQAMEYTKDGEEMVDSDSVNWDKYRLSAQIQGES